MAYHADRLQAPASKVWRFLQWEGAELVVPGGILEKVEYEERRPILGAIRRVWFDGHLIRERLETLPEHPSDFVLDYRIVDMGGLPFAEFRGGVRVTPAGEAACIVSFACHFTPLGISVEEWQSMYVAFEKRQIAFIRSQVE